MQIFHGFAGGKPKVWKFSNLKEAESGLKNGLKN